MEGESYNEFKQSVMNDIREMRGLILLRTPESLEAYGDTLAEIGQHIRDSEKKLAQFRIQVAKELEYLENANKLIQLVEQQKEDLEYIQTHLPSRLPGKPLNEITITDTRETTQKKTEEAPPTLPSSSLQSAPPDIKKVDTKKTNSTQVPTIAYVTVSELEATPKYLKGRLTLDKVNAGIEELQKMVQAKYKILSQPAAKLNEKILKKYKGYKDQETNETKGIHFIAESDLHESTNLKPGDATGKSIISVLRHLHRVKDLGGTTKRFAIVGNVQ